MVAQTNVCPWCRTAVASRASCLRHVVTMSKSGPLLCPARATSFSCQPEEKPLYTCGYCGREDSCLNEHLRRVRGRAARARFPEPLPPPCSWSRPLLLPPGMCLYGAF
eukprot:4954800-Pyramimonas_sp.AAC.1